MGVKGRAERGCGLLFQRGGVGHVGKVGLGMWGPEETSGWLRKAVERVRGGTGVMPCLGRSCCWFLNKFETRFARMHESFQ
jgi:hypothetical protein